MAEISVKNWIERFESGEYDSPDHKTQVEAGWYDWFCKTESLAKKTQRIGRIIARINNNDNILENMSVFFKSNFPIDHPLYDLICFCDLKTGDVIYCVEIDCGFNESKYVVTGGENINMNLFETNSVYKLAEWFNTRTTDSA